MSLAALGGRPDGQVAEPVPVAAWLALAVVAIFGFGVLKLTFAIGINSVPTMAWLARGSTRAVRVRAAVQAADQDMYVAKRSRRPPVGYPQQALPALRPESGPPTR